MQDSDRKIIDRDKVLEKILSLPHKSILCELATSFGKSRIAIEIIKKRNLKKILIVVPRNVLKNNWKDEINKWYPDNNLNITFTTYISYPKHAGTWDAIIYDEVHHLSERCQEAVKGFDSKCNVLLSATVKKELKRNLYHLFDNLASFTVSAKQAIDHSILPDPKVILLPLILNSTDITETIVINPKAKKTVTLDFKNRFQLKDKNKKYVIRCTQQQYYSDLSDKINWYKKKAMGGNIVMKNRWLFYCGERLKWLSSIKTPVVQKILGYLKKERTLTFCSSIEQTEKLGTYCINSHNKKSSENLAKFNDGKINHITAVNMLNEGMNLVNCRVGVYANLNSSETIIAQRLGRLLRHKDPVIILPYYVGTRDEEIKDKMIKDYNKDLTRTIYNIDKLDL